MGLLVPQRNVTSLQTQTKQFLRLLKEFTGQDDHKVGSVAHLRILLLTRHNEELGGRVDDFQLAQDRCSVRREDQLLQVVDDDLVAAVGT